MRFLRHALIVPAAAIGLTLVHCGVQAKSQRTAGSTATAPTGQPASANAVAQPSPADSGSFSLAPGTFGAFTSATVTITPVAGGAPTVVTWAAGQTELKVGGLLPGAYTIAITATTASGVTKAASVSVTITAGGVAYATMTPVPTSPSPTTGSVVIALPNPSTPPTSEACALAQQAAPLFCLATPATCHYTSPSGMLYTSKAACNADLAKLHLYAEICGDSLAFPPAEAAKVICATGTSPLGLAGTIQGLITRTIEGGAQLPPGSAPPTPTPTPASGISVTAMPDGLMEPLLAGNATANTALIASPFHATSDADGRYTLAVPAGSYTVSVDQSLFLAQLTAPQHVTVVAGGAPIEADFSFVLMAP